MTKERIEKELSKVRAQLEILKLLEEKENAKEMAGNEEKVIS